MPHNTEKVRLLTNDDIELVEHLLRTTEYAYQRFTYEEQ